MNTWFLVIFLKFGNAGGSVTVPQLTQAQCIEQSVALVKERDVLSAICVKGAK